MSRLDENEQALREKDETIAAEQQHLRRQENENHQLMRERDQAIEEKKRIERQLGRVNQQLEESERVIAQFQRQTSKLWQLGLATPRSKEQSSGRASIKLT
jgi:septal ring factor EnvC (AmiA/AmiB activator)